MATKSELISDIILRATQGSPSDDSEIESDQIAAWIDQTAPAFIKNEIDAELAAGRFIPQLYIRMEDCKVIETEDIDCQADCVDRVYIELDGYVIDLKDDSGIVRVITDEGDHLKTASIGTLDMLKHLRFAKPSMTNPVYYRQGGKIYIEGIKKADLQFNFITVWYVEKQRVQDLSDSDEVRLSDQIRAAVIDTVAEKLKMQMYGSLADPDNNGVDPKNLVYHTAIKNNPTSQSPTE